MSHRSLLLAAAFLLGCLSLDACTGEPTFTDEGSAPTSTPSDEADTTEAEVPIRRPKVGECHRVRSIDFTINRDDSGPVSCSGRHNSETFLVVSLRKVTELPAIDTIGERCRRRFRSYVGNHPDVSTLDWTVLMSSGRGPGEIMRFGRCDVIETATYDGSKVRSRRTSTQGILNGGVPAPLARCMRAWPPKVLVPCTKPHGARLVPPVVRLGTTAERFPGRGPLEETARSRCNIPLREVASGAFRFGYTFPTRDQWRDGFRTGTCWLLAEESEALPALPKNGTAPATD